MIRKSPIYQRMFVLDVFCCITLKDFDLEIDAISMIQIRSSAVVVAVSLYIILQLEIVRHLIPSEFLI
jgi:hypothetical protein